MNRVIGDDAIKISLIQTLPGREFSVAAALEEACIKAGLTKFAIFKGFGSYDIIFIHAWKDFSSVLTEFGPIPGIIKTTKSFCYHHVIGSSDDFFAKVKKETFASITIVKISNDRKLSCYGSERTIIDELASMSNGHSFFFGTLGWSELIAVTTGENLNDIINGCLLPSYGITSRLIQKTYSIIALNYETLPYRAKASTDLKPVLESVSALDAEIDPNVVIPIITVTCFPGASADLLDYWCADRYDICDLIGKEDIQILPKKGVKWSDLINDLFVFRSRFKSSIHSTTTYIAFYGDTDRREITIATTNPPAFDYEFETIKTVFGDKGLALSTTLNTLKGLIGNRIVCDAFEDMSRYHEYLIAFASDMDPKKKTNFLLQVNDTINKSAEIRLYGTYGTIEENVGQFNKLHGGAQRSIQAISYLPSVTLARTLGKFQYIWKGFISVSNYQFYNTNEVIHVPIDSLWNPGSWWAINHEVGHIIINNAIYEDGTGIVDNKNVELNMFLASKNNPDHWLQLVIELAAEYLGYELGFYGNYDLFLEKVWIYLKDLAPKNLLYSPLSIYAIRTYFIKFFENMFVHKSISPDYAADYDSIYEEIIDHIEHIQRIGGNDTSDEVLAFYSDKYVIAAYYAPTFKSLIPWMRDVFHPAVEELGCRRNVKELVDSNTNEIVSCLEAGIVWDQAVNFPEAVLYKLYQKQQIPFKMAIATVLTFWNLNKSLRNHYV